MPSLGITLRPWRHGLTVPEFRGRAVRTHTWAAHFPQEIAIDRHAGNQTLLETLEVPSTARFIKKADVTAFILAHPSRFSGNEFRVWGHGGHYRDAKTALEYAAKGLESGALLSTVILPIMMRCGNVSDVLKSIPEKAWEFQNHLLSGRKEEAISVIENHEGPNRQDFRMYFEGLNLHGMDFSALQFWYASFNKAALGGTDFRSAVFFDSVLCYCDFGESDFRGAVFLNNSSIAGSDVSRANFDGAFIHNWGDCVRNTIGQAKGQVIIPRGRKKEYPEVAQFAKGGYRFLSQADVDAADTPQKKEVFEMIFRHGP